MFLRRWKPDSEREDVCSTDGTVTFNYLQQLPDECDTPRLTPVEECGTTDPLGVTDD